jgi:hypothetical protein
MVSMRYGILRLRPKLAVDDFVAVAFLIVQQASFLGRWPGRFFEAFYAPGCRPTLHPDENPWNKPIPKGHGSADRRHSSGLFRAPQIRYPYIGEGVIFLTNLGSIATHPAFRRAGSTWIRLRLCNTLAAIKVSAAI